MKINFVRVNLNKVIRLRAMSVDFLLRWPFKIRFKEMAINIFYIKYGVKKLNKEKLYELCNFIYYKISTIIKVLLANMSPRAFLPQSDPSPNDGQLSLSLIFEN